MLGDIRAREERADLAELMSPAEVAEAQKKLDGLNAEIVKRREARGKLTTGTPEYAAADKLVQDGKPEIEKATAAVAAAKAKLK